QAQNVLAAVAEAEASVGQRQQPSGILRVSCPVSFGQLQIMPFIERFLNQYPKIQLKLTMSDRFVDLVETGVDLAIRIGQVQASNLKIQQIGCARRVVVASATYLESQPEPRTPKDLVQHNCLIYQPTGSVWTFQTPAGRPISVKVSGNFQVDNSVAIRMAVLQDIGIAFVPIWLLEDLMQSPKICVLLSDFQPQPLPIQVVYQQRRFISAKVRCFIDYLSQEFDADPRISD
ncbi:MAG: substrate binding domain-containing protein, partial [Cyanobacteria bacterium J06623_4]